MRILVAEDDPVSRTLLTRSLEQWGHEVEPVADGMEAYGRLLRPNAPPIAILDWTMPGLEGPEICRQVRAATLRMQPYLVILTARHTSGDLATALDSGADDFLSKPFDRIELQARLQAGVRIVNLHRALTDRIQELEESRQREHSLRTLTPICSYCKKIRGDKDTWEPIDQYLAEHGYRITHAVCPSCLDGMSTLPPMPR